MRPNGDQGSPLGKPIAQMQDRQYFEKLAVQREGFAARTENCHRIA
jgi:hypothetical protein